MQQYIKLVRKEFDLLQEVKPKPNAMDLVKFAISLFNKGQSLLLTPLYLRKVSTGNRVFCNGKPSVVVLGELCIGSRTSLWSTIQRTRLSVFKNASMVIGEDTFINGARISAKQSIIIGDNVQIAPDVIIMDSDFHDVKNHICEGSSAEVIIGNNVWIATRAMILKGVTIGEGAVVAAGAVVTKNVEPFTLVAGTPARFIKYLN